jgi:YVTN family beta-propeller protein
VLLPIGGVRQRSLLAILLLNANRVVSRERLVEELSGDERGPASDHALRVQTSRLRQALRADGIEGEPRLVAQAPGYVLRVEPGELDLERFEQLVADGRRALADGSGERAVDLLRAAESLWRGRPLADLEFQPSARLDIERLEELRLTVVEERVEAELALGRHAALVGELETFVAQHPLRETGRAHLMLALYRSGRQVEALDGYRTARTQIDEEFGLHPGSRLRDLELAILQQDAGLELPARADTAVLPPPPAPGKRKRWLLVGALAAIAGGVALAIAAIGGDAGIRPVTGDGIVQVSARTGNLLAFVALDAPPTRIAAGSRWLWVSHYDAGTVSAVDPRARAVRQTISVGDGPTGLAVAGGDVWVANTLGGTVSRIDAGTRTVVQTIAVGSEPTAVAGGGRAVWVANRADDTVSRLDASSGRVTARIGVGRGPSAVVVDGASLWVANQDAGTVSRIDTRDNHVVETVHVGDAPAAIAASPGGIWVADSLDSTVSRIDRARGIVTLTIPVRGTPEGLAVAGGSVSVTDEDGGTIAQIGSGGGAVGWRSRVGSRTGPVAVAGGNVWVGTKAGGPSHRGGTITVVDGGFGVRSIDPLFAAEVVPLELSGLTNDGLVTLNHVAGPSGAQLVPDLAVALPRPSADGRTYVFRMRPGIRYSTGGTVRPTDVRRTFERLFELRAGAGIYDIIAGARACTRRRSCDLSSGIVANDRDNTVTFHLAVPEPEFLFTLTLPYADIVPATTPSREARTPLPATGPYRIGAYVPGREVRFTRNPRFRVWSPAAQPDGFPDRITLRAGLDPHRAATLVEQGRVDLMMNAGAAPAGQRDLLRTRLPGQLRVHAAGTTTIFDFLNTRAPPFDDVRVRRALNYAIDRDRVVALLGGRRNAQPTCQILPPQLPGFHRYCPYTRGPRADGRWTGPDLPRARRLVAASGTGGMRVRVWGATSQAEDRAHGRYVVSVLRRLGFRATLHLLSPTRFLAYTNDSRNRAQVIAGTWGAAWPSASNFIARLGCRFFVPGSPTSANGSEFCDPAIDRMTDRAMALAPRNPVAGHALWARLDRELTGRAIWLPLATPKTTDIISSRAHNYALHPIWGPLIDQLWVR